VAAGVPIVTYFHESQFTYPLSPMDRHDATYAMKNWASAAVSDLVAFNSEYHRDVFAAEADAMLRAFPEYTHLHRLDPVMERSIVLPVGVDLAPFSVGRLPAGEPPLIVWNHRWEHDKGPEDLAAIVAALDRRGVDYRMAMCGEIFVSVPEPFDGVVSMLGDRAIQRGFADRPRYERLLLEASVVLSTAHQEFFGIGVVEAIAAGAHPVLPNRLVYPERVAALGLDGASVLYGSPEEAAALIEAALRRPPDGRVTHAAMRYDWSVVAPMYDAALATA
jgi:glycosyltransferase involved in cell wall biosynthesis